MDFNFDELLKGMGMQAPNKWLDYVQELLRLNGELQKLGKRKKKARV